MTAAEAITRIVVDPLARGKYATDAALTRGERLGADDLRRVPDEYGREFVRVPEEWWATVEVTELDNPPKAFHVAAPLWTAEEGRSELTLELRLTESIPGILDPVILDLHVL